MSHYAVRSFRAAPRAAGFSLLEMLAVIVLIGIVAGIVVTKVGDNVKKGKYNAGPPQNLNDLKSRPGNASNWKGPYAKDSDLKDPFGHEFGYKAPGEHGDFDIVFYGADGQSGGDSYNQDVGNWQ